MPELNEDFTQLADDVSQLANKNARMREINSQMLSALRYALPILQEGLSPSINFDQVKEAITKAQNAIAEAERDP